MERTPAADQINICMQCGTCTGGCPSAVNMDFTPRQIIHLLQLGEIEEAMRCDGIWACLNCYACTVRCPRDIKVSEVFEGLRAMAFARKIAPSRDHAFHESFLRVVEEHGRVFEPEMMMRFSLRTNPFSLLKQAPMGLNMLRKGKMPLLPHRSKGRKQVKRRFFKNT